MPNTVPAAATGLPAPTMIPPPHPLPNRMTVADEFLQLMDMRRRVDHRLVELAHVLDGNDPRQAVTLPKSGLRLRAARPGFFLFEGGRS